jgi:hypothetical protein
MLKITVRPSQFGASFDADGTLMQQTKKDSLPVLNAFKQPWS